MDNDVRTIQTILEEYNLNWRVESRPAYQEPDAPFIDPIEGVFYAWRSDTGRAIPHVAFSGAYTPVSNAEVLAPAALLMGEANATVISAKEYYHGRYVSMVLELPGSIAIPIAGALDTLKKRLEFTNSHDAKSALAIRFFACRPNGGKAVELSPSEVSSFRFTHNRKVGEKLVEVPDLLGATDTFFNLFEDALTEFSETMPSEADVNGLIDHVIPPDPGNKGVTENRARLRYLLARRSIASWYGLYVACLTWLEGASKFANEDTRWKSLSTGVVALRKVELFKYVAQKTGTGQVHFEFRKEVLGGGSQ